LCSARRTTGTLVADAAGDWRARWELEGEVIACPWHGLEFHVPTGRCLADPRLSLRVFEVSVRGDDVVVRF
jgi:nitrite reductase (NADH) small subunit